MLSYYQIPSKFNFFLTWHLNSVWLLMLSLGICVAFVVINVFVHELAHLLAFRYFGYRARMIFLPWRLAWVRASHGRAIFASLGFCYVDDREAQSMSPLQVQVSAIAGPLFEAVFFIALATTLWHLATAFRLYPLQFALLVFCPVFCAASALNWIPLRCFKNDGWLMWNAPAAVRDIRFSAGK